MKKVLVPLILIMILSGIVNASFTRSFLAVKISLNEDGSANVREELRFVMDDVYTVDSYSTWIKSANDLSGWRDRTKLSDIRYHVDATEVSIKNTGFNQGIQILAILKEVNAMGCLLLNTR